MSLDVLYGFLLGIVASTISWLIVRAVRPRLKISDKLCLNPDGHICVKVINRGHRKTIDLAFYCSTLRKDDDHRYPESLTIGRVETTPAIQAVLHGKSSKERKRAGLSMGRVVRLGISTDRGLTPQEFFVKFPNGKILVQAIALDSITNSRLVASVLYNKSSIVEGVFGRDDTSII